MPTCCLCDQPADPDRRFGGRFPMCLQDYSDARVGRLDDDKAAKLRELQSAPVAAPVPDLAVPASKRARAEAGEGAGVGEQGTDG